MRCRDERGKKCFFWFFKWMFSVDCRKESKYTITCAQERDLINNGKKDAKEDNLNNMVIDEKPYSITDYVGEMVRSFGVVVRDEWTKSYIKDITNSNLTVVMSMEKGLDAIERSKAIIQAQQDLIKNLPLGDSRINMHIGKIEAEKLSCLDTIISSNDNGNKACQNAIIKKDTYNAFFEREWAFCKEKIGIYKTSLIRKGRKLHGEKYRNINFPSDIELLKMNDIDNPTKSADFEIKQYTNIQRPEEWSD